MPKEGFRTLLFSLLVIAIAFLSYSIGAMSAEGRSPLRVFLTSRDLAIVEKTLALIESRYVKPVEDEKEFIYGAVQGLVERLRREPYNDRYSAFLDPVMWRSLSAATQGSYSGVGIVIGLDPDKNLPVISSVFENTPAALGGLKERDLILSVDNESTENKSLDEVAKKILGKEGTQVTLTILREGWNQPRAFTLTRKQVEVKSVLDEKLLAEDIGYFRIASFGLKTYEETKTAIEDLLSKGAKSLIIDLRYNPGGLLDSAVKIADLFLSKGVIVKVEQRGEEPVLFTANSEDEDLELPVVILVNRYSASASEVLAAALRDNQRAKIVGEDTFGKGTVQEVYELEKDGVALSLTVGRYLTPSGHDLSEKPISPDIRTTLDELKKDYPSIAKKQEQIKTLSDKQAELAAELFKEYSDAQLEISKKLAKAELKKKR